MNAAERRRFALSHLTFERNAAMGETNGIEEAEKLLAPLGWRWITARLVPRREINPKHAEIVNRIEMLHETVLQLTHEFYMGDPPSDEAWDDLDDEVYALARAREEMES